MLPQAPWSPTAHAFAQHQFSHVANFWKQGRHASFWLKALPGGHAELNLTFQLPQASEVVPPPSHVSPFPAVQRPIHPLFPEDSFPQGDKPKPASPTVSSRYRKNYRRSVLHRAGLAASSLPSPKHGSLRQAASACVQRLQVDQVKSARKRPLLVSPSPQTSSPLAQKIRADFQIGERELLRSEASPERSPPPISPCVKGFPSPAPLVFTPSKNQEDAEFPTSNLKENVEEKAAARKADTVNASKAEITAAEKCWNCDEVFTPEHQCSSVALDRSVASSGAQKCMSSGLLPIISDSVLQSRPSRIIKNLKKFCPVCETYYKASSKCQSCLPPAPPP